MRLVCISGLLNGSEFPITQAPLTFGRAADNHASLEDDLASRYHAEFRLQDRQAVARDLGSTNGTWVNGERITKRVLRHHDMVRIGSSTFIYKHRRDPREVEPHFITGERDRLRKVETLRADHCGATPDTAPLREIHLDLLLQAIPHARRAAMLLTAGDADEFAIGTFRPMPFDVSDMVTHRALRENLPILSNDGHSILCVPLAANGANIGVIYADNGGDGGEPFNDADFSLFRLIARAAAEAHGLTRHAERLEKRVERLQEEIDLQHDMIGNSSAMRTVYEFARDVSPTDATVLILGESGTGKELLARAIHRNSVRSEQPFVAVNCGAIPETLVHAELFGVEKGAYTDATARRIGRIEAAAGGTLFLDEVGDLAPTTQVALLRVIQQREFERLGGTETIAADVRLVAATNRNLQEMVKDGRFRHDLYFRLKVMAVTMPPLRDRREDIPVLANHFRSKHAHPKPISGFTPEAIKILNAFEWPGNVRELENAVQHGCIRAKSEFIRPENLPAYLTEQVEEAETLNYHDGLQRAKRALVTAAERKANGNKTETARILGIDRSYLYDILEELNR